HETDLVLRRLLFVQPSLHPLHRVLVGTHWVWTRRVGVIRHAGKLVAALAHDGRQIVLLGSRKSRNEGNRTPKSRAPHPSKGKRHRQRSNGFPRFPWTGMEA